VKVCGYVRVGEGREKLKRNLIHRMYPKGRTDCTSLYSRISVMRLVHGWRVVRVLSNPFVEQYNFLIKLPAAISETRLEH
jgi:hypothetical protein